MSRLLPPSSTPSSTTAKASRRLSRVSPSEFDRVLQGNDTAVLGAGRDESTLGTASSLGSELASSGGETEEDELREQGEEIDDNIAAASTGNTLDSLSNGTNRRSILATTAMKASSSSSAAARSSNSYKRRSMNRSLGTSSSQEMASLARRIKRASVREASDSEVEDEEESEPEVGAAKSGRSTPIARRLESDLNEEDEDDASITPGRPSTSSSLRNSATSPSPSEVVTPSRVNRLSKSPASTIRRNSPSSNRPRSSLLSNLPANNVRDSMASQGSYVHVPFSSLSGKESGLSPSRALEKKTPEAGEQKTSFNLANTMRKTSRFFRKLGGGSPATASTVATARTSTDAPQISQTTPPVPPIPIAYTPSSTYSSSSPPSTPPSKLRRQLVPVSTDSTSTATTTKTIPEEPLLRTVSTSSSPNVSPAQKRRHRKSLSLDSMASTSLLSGGMALPREGKKPVVIEGQRKSALLLGDDPLYKELQKWKKDIDGVLGSIGDGSELRFTPNPDTLASTKDALPSPPTSTIGKLRKLQPVSSFIKSNRTLSTPSPPQSPNLPAFAPHSFGPSFNDTNKAFGELGSGRTSSSTLPIGKRDKWEGDEPVKNLERRGSLPITRTKDRGGEDVFSSSSSTNVLPPTILDQNSTLPLAPLVSSPSDLAAPEEAQGLETITESNSNSTLSTFASPPRKGDTEATPETEAEEESLAIPVPVLITQGPSPASSAVALVLPEAPIPIASESDNVPQTQDEQKKGEEDVEVEEKAKECANKCWEEDESFLKREKIAEWMGMTPGLNVATLRLYMDMFNFEGLRLDVAFRRLCDKLYLKAETQQVDRIIEQFSRRYFENNPASIYGSADIVHAVAYSLLLLNTDLHIVDSITRMRQGQFVRNTMSAIRSQQDVPEPPSTGLLFASSSRTNLPKGNDSLYNLFGGEESRKSLDKYKGDTAKTLSRRSAMGSSAGGASMPNLNATPPKFVTSLSSSALENGTKRFSQRTRVMETELESMLKKLYDAIKFQPIFQPMASNLSLPLDRSTTSLSPISHPYGTWSGLNRSPSRRSATSSGSVSSGLKQASMRGFSSLMGTSSDLTRSTSPTPSTSTSFTEDNVSSFFSPLNSQRHLTPTIGFANSLSNTIIREQAEDDTKLDGEIVVTDEELALLGAPWAKEGIIYRKHYRESVGKRAKEKSWLQVFVVIAKGEVKMFRFDGAGTIKAGGKQGMGGGDWSSTAQSVGEVSLTHALCSTMPPPGYSRSRPHCFVLTLPGGGSYFFQAGTQDLIGEWVSTCNYWSARLSKEPLSGGVSNMEYGWNKIVDMSIEGEVEEEETLPAPSIRSGKSGKSGHSSRHSSFYGSVNPVSNNVNDRITISDWTPPSAPTGFSTLAEDAQLESLRRHVVIIKQELQNHTAIRVPMTRLFSTRSVNMAKAMANWERKSQHLLSETVKYETYIEALSSAVRLRALKRGEKEVEEMLLAADDQPADMREPSPQMETVELPPRDIPRRRGSAARIASVPQILEEVFVPPEESGREQEASEGKVENEESCTTHLYVSVVQ